MKLYFLFLLHVFLSVASHFMFGFYTALQLHAGLNHVIASQFIVEEPNSFTKLCNSPMTEDGSVEGR